MKPRTSLCSPWAPASKRGSPRAIVELAAAAPGEAVDRRRHLRPLLAELLALARRQRGEEVVPARVAAVVPVELVRRAGGEAEPGQPRLLVGGAEQPVDRRALR